MSALKPKDFEVAPKDFEVAPKDFEVAEPTKGKQKGLGKQRRATANLRPKPNRNNVQNQNAKKIDKKFRKKLQFEKLYNQLQSMDKFSTEEKWLSSVKKTSPEYYQPITRYVHAFKEKNPGKKFFRSRGVPGPGVPGLWVLTLSIFAMILNGVTAREAIDYSMNWDHNYAMNSNGFSFDQLSAATATAPAAAPAPVRRMDGKIDLSEYVIKTLNALTPAEKALAAAEEAAGAAAEKAAAEKAAPAAAPAAAPTAAPAAAAPAAVTGQLLLPLPAKKTDGKQLAPLNSTNKTNTDTDTNFSNQLIQFGAGVALGLGLGAGGRKKAIKKAVSHEKSAAEKAAVPVAAALVAKTKAKILATKAKNKQKRIEQKKAAEIRTLVRNQASKVPLEEQDVWEWEDDEKIRLYIHDQTDGTYYRIRKNLLEGYFYKIDESIDKTQMSELIDNGVVVMKHIDNKGRLSDPDPVIPSTSRNAKITRKLNITGKLRF